MANVITGSRILCSFGILFCLPLSPAFYTLYVVAGFSDMIDGAVARRTGSVSRFGSLFDTAADFVFVAVCLIKLLPILAIPRWLYFWIAAVALIKAINIASGYVVRKRLVTPHTLMNKITGALLFALPLTLSVIDLRCSAAVVCVAATAAAIQEGHLIRTGKEE